MIKVERIIIKSNLARVFTH